MDLVFIPTLQDMAIGRVAAAICEHPNIHPFTLCSIQYSESEKEKRILDEIQKLTLPNLIQALVLIRVKILCLEIQSWRREHKLILCSAVNRLIKFYYRYDGSIDRSKTAQALVKNENVYYTPRFRLATCYFLEEDVKGLWMMIHSLRMCDLFDKLFRHEPFLAVWGPWYRSGGSRELIDILENEISVLPVFGFLLILANAGASFLCFIEKLPMDKRLEWMKHIAREQFMTRDLVLYCISGPLRNQQMEVFRENPLKVLYIFLTWPLQNMFMDVAKHLWDHLGERNFLLVFIQICHKIREGHQDEFNYSELKEEFWYNSPLPYRESVINRQRNRDEQILRANIEDHIPPLFRN